MAKKKYRTDIIEEWRSKHYGIIRSVDADPKAKLISVVSGEDRRRVVMYIRREI